MYHVCSLFEPFLHGLLNCAVYSSILHMSLTLPTFYFPFWYLGYFFQNSVLFGCDCSTSKLKVARIDEAD